MATENQNTQLKLGRGKLYLAPCPDGGELTDAREFRFIGNAPEFSVTFESETLPHYQSTGGIREQDASVEPAWGRASHLPRLQGIQSTVKIFRTIVFGKDL